MLHVEYRREQTLLMAQFIIGSLLEAQFIIDIDTLIILSDASRSYCDWFINIYEGSSIDKVELSK